MKRFFEEYGGVLIVLFCTFVFLVGIPTFTNNLVKQTDNLIKKEGYEKKDYIKNDNGTNIKYELKIDDVVYTYEEGMSWQEWINSSYNTGNYSIFYNPCTGQEHLGLNHVKELVNGR